MLGALLRIQQTDPCDLDQEGSQARVVPGQGKACGPPAWGLGNQRQDRILSKPMLATWGRWSSASAHRWLGPFGDSGIPVCRWSLQKTSTLGVLPGTVSDRSLGD